MSTAPASARRRRGAVALGGAALTVLTLLVTAGPALAIETPEGKLGDALTPLESVLLFVVLPVVALVVTGIATAIPRARRRPRYRPQRGWERGAVWFAGPRGSRTVVEDAVRAAEVRPEGLGGARGDW